MPESESEIAIYSTQHIEGNIYTVNGNIDGEDVSVVAVLPDNPTEADAKAALERGGDQEAIDKYNEAKAEGEEVEPPEPPDSLGGPGGGPGTPGFPEVGHSDDPARIAEEQAARAGRRRPADLARPGDEKMQEQAGDSGAEEEGVFDEPVDDNSPMDYEAMTTAQLRDHAASQNIDVSHARTKPEIISVLVAHDNAQHR